MRAWGPQQSMAFTRVVSVADDYALYTIGVCPRPAVVEWLWLVASQAGPRVVLSAVGARLPDLVAGAVLPTLEGETLFEYTWESGISAGQVGLSLRLANSSELIPINKVVGWAPWYLRVLLRGGSAANTNFAGLVSVRWLEEESLQGPVLVRELAHQQALMSARGGTVERAGFTYARHVSP